MIVSVGLLIGQPLLVRYAIAALLFKFTWTFVLPFILARVAGLDNSGRLMNSINLVIGGGMAAGPALAGALLQHFASADPLLAAAGVCALLSLILIVAASAAGRLSPREDRGEKKNRFLLWMNVVGLAQYRPARGDAAGGRLGTAARRRRSC
ncbi:major facilitator family transporter [Klebsiella pneumoniae]|uniref:Major facilitator family transporter n=1 Tax=Klebsiella pneumoniae TaxID=573 RepID=A0A2X3CKL7_KLEPN|nr:major facilitator family transporter [Klebsiella pneumoniae]